MVYLVHGEQSVEKRRFLFTIVALSVHFTKIWNIFFFNNVAVVLFVVVIVLLRSLPCGHCMEESDYLQSYYSFYLFFSTKLDM